MLSALDAAVHETHGEVLGEVTAPLGDEHCHTEHHILLLTQLHEGSHGAGAVAGLVGLGAPVAPGEFCHHARQGVCGVGVLGQHLFLGERLEGVGEGVESFGRDAQEIDTFLVEVAP